MIRLILTLLALSALSATAGLLVLNGRLVVLDGKAVNIEAPTDLIPRTGLVAWYRGAGNATDSAGTNNATWTGTAAYTNGAVGQAFDMDSADLDSVESINTISSSSNYMSFATWVYRKGDGVGGAPGIVCYGAGAIGGAPRMLLFTSSNKPGVFVEGTSSGGNNISTNIIPLNTWIHLAAVYDGATQKIYVNGNVDLSVSQSVGALTGSKNIYIGRNPNANYFNGSIDETLIYNRALTPAEIAILANPASYPPE
jgi:hypothetical protein